MTILPDAVLVILPLVVTACFVVAVDSLSVEESPPDSPVDAVNVSTLELLVTGSLVETIEAAAPVGLPVKSVGLFVVCVEMLVSEVASRLPVELPKTVSAVELTEFVFESKTVDWPDIVEILVTV